MKIKKRLKEEVQLTDESIFETGKDLKAKLIEEYCAPTEKVILNKPIYRRKPVIATACCIFVCLLTVGVCLPVFLNKDKPIDTVKPIEYLKENETVNDTTLDNIYSVVNLRMNEDDFSVTMPKIIQDSISEDTLYFMAKIESKIVFPYGEIYFVTNPNYVLYEDEAVNEFNCKWKNYDVTYNVLSNALIEIPSVQVTGCLEYGQLRIYFTYTDVDLGEPTIPLSFLDSLFNI